MKSAIKQALRPLARGGAAMLAGTAVAVGLKQLDPAPVHYLIEEQDWAIRRVGTGIRDGV
ncbi:MAG: hypothetical protein HOK83_14885, partial [Rhodospirillaceae bacterium]|nr:hypothetical protein [Rhodospirillaceae bacterium]